MAVGSDGVWDQSIALWDWATPELRREGEINYAYVMVAEFKKG